MGKFKVSATVMGNLEKRNVLRQDGFRLFDGFTGEYETKSYVPRKMNGADDANAFTITAQHSDKKKNLVLPDYIFLNARVVKDSTSFVKMAGHEGIGFYEDNQALIAASQLLNAEADRNETGDLDEFNIPDKFKIVGALTRKIDVDGKVEPAIPLRLYKGYNAVLSYHRNQLKEQKDPNWQTAFITRDDFMGYLKRNSDKDITIPGVPPEMTKMELAVPDAPSKPEYWTVQLILQDVAG